MADQRSNEEKTGWEKGCGRISRKLGGGRGALSRLFGKKMETKWFLIVLIVGIVRGPNGHLIEDVGIVQR